MDDGGESGIRTHGTLLTYTRFPSVRLKPLGHLSSNAECRVQNAELREVSHHLSFFCILHSAFLHSLVSGGEGGIRTPDTRKGITVFETAAFSHSATSPFPANVRVILERSSAKAVGRAPAGSR